MAGTIRAEGSPARIGVRCMTKQETREPMPSVKALEHDPKNPFQNLANAIVCAAADDYRIAMNTGNEDLVKAIEQFFHSRWYCVLTSLDSSWLIEALRTGNTRNSKYPNS